LGEFDAAAKMGAGTDLMKRARYTAEQFIRKSCLMPDRMLVSSKSITEVA